ncbi:MAG: hypothetical protein JSS97_02020 [Actinobacteria bacterium]|nr:hypothetical protein [Actinomycetota bacterium]
MSKRITTWRRSLGAMCAAALAILGAALASPAAALNHEFTAFSPEAGPTDGSTPLSCLVTRLAARFTVATRAHQRLEPSANLLGSSCYVGFTERADMPRVAVNRQSNAIGGPRHDNDLSSASPAFCPV